jgi:hypothetical protein
VGPARNEELSRSMASREVGVNRKFNLKRGELIMKTIRLLLVSFFVLCLSTTTVVASKSNESDKAKIQRAMKAAPNSISAHARILDTEWNELEDEWNELRPATNGNTWTCFPGVPVNDGDKHPMCNDQVWMNWLHSVVHLFETNFEEWIFVTDTVGYSYMLRGDALVDNNDPTGSNPNGLWDQEGPHIMMLFPTETELADLYPDPDAGGPYIMWGGTPLIHVMVPITDRDK